MYIYIYICILTETHHTEGDMLGGLIDGYSKSIDSAGTPLEAAAAREGTSILLRDASGVSASRVKLAPLPKGFRSLVWTRLQKKEWVSDIYLASIYLEWGNFRAKSKALRDFRDEVLGVLEVQIYEIRTKDPDAIVIVTGDLNVHLGDKQTANAAADWPRNSPCTTKGDKRTAKRLLAALDADKANMPRTIYGSDLYRLLILRATYGRGGYYRVDVCSSD